MMFVGFLGCYGAIQESQCLLGTVSRKSCGAGSRVSGNLCLPQGFGLSVCFISIESDSEDSY